MAFIEQTDLERYIDPDDLIQIVDGDATVVPGAISDGLEFVKEMLRQRYDVEFEMSLTGANRNASLLKQSIAVVLFFVSERLPTDTMPESRGMSYDRAVDWLKQCASGSRMPNLKELENNTGVSIRYGNTSTSKNNHY